MALFKKKKEEKELRLPELPAAFPELPSLPPEAPEREEPSKLPPLPQIPQLPQLPQLKPIPRIPQLPPQIPQLPPLQLPERAERGMPLLKPMTMEIEEERKAAREGPIFVKIDKFKEAMAHFELVRKKLQESSALLEKIKETRAKEEEELNQWSAELSALKEKIASIDRKIFSSLE